MHEGERQGACVDNVPHSPTPSFSAATTFRGPRRALDELLRFVSVVFASAARIGDLIRILSPCRQETKRATEPYMDSLQLVSDFRYVF